VEPEVALGVAELEGPRAEPGPVVADLETQTVASPGDVDGHPRNSRTSPAPMAGRSETRASWLRALTEENLM